MTAASIEDESESKNDRKNRREIKYSVREKRLRESPHTNGTGREGGETAGRDGVNSSSKTSPLTVDVFDAPTLLPYIEYSIVSELTLLYSIRVSSVFGGGI